MAGARAQTPGRRTRPFRFGSEDQPDPDAPLGAGALVGERYEIVQLLGEGGMGRVYEARHTVLQRRVALKLLRRDAAQSEENLARFRQEALAASSIGAPQIVEIVDFATHGHGASAQTYMVMELLAGESLEGWMARPGRLAEGLSFLAELCDGLDAAHHAGVIHRDIKPANVFLCRGHDGVRVKILDFGIAKVTAGGSGYQTQQGSLLGTPYYLAPERVVGEQLSPAADIYSVGVILYEMLVGDVPFAGESFMAILAQHVNAAPLDPRQAAPERGIPDSAAELCMRLLAKRSAARPGSAAEVAAALRGLPDRDSALASVVTGPRDVHGQAPGDQTQVLDEASASLSARPTAPPSVVVASPSTVPVTTPVVAPPIAEPASLPDAGGTFGVAVATALIALVLVGGGLLGARAYLQREVPEAGAKPETTPTATPETPADATPEIPPALAGEGDPTVENDQPQPGPLAGPEDAASADLGNPASDAAVVAEAPEAATPENTEKPRKPRKPRSGTKGKGDAASETPEPETPEPEAPEPEVPDSKPEPAAPDPSLPTIKDDVYD